MAFFFKSFPIKTEPTTEVGSDTELVSEHLRSKGSSTDTEPCPPNTERYCENARSAPEIKAAKSDDDTTAGVTFPGMTWQPQMPLKPFACEYCGWRFNLKKDLVHHVRTHTGEKPYACSDCGKQFARVHSLNLHRGRQNSSEDGKPYSCTRCSKRFWTKGCYLSHYKSTHDECPRLQAATLQVESAFAADRCSAEDNQIPNGSVITDDTPNILYLPQSAGAASFDDEHTSNLQNRTENSQVSTFSATPLGGGKRGVRFTCQYCGWGFWDKKDRKQHEWTHTGLKPYQCQECGKNFSRSYTLKLHIRAHDGEKPFSCQFCNKTFTGPGSLRIHTKTHTKVHKHKCPECPLSFKRMDLFKIHQREHLNSNSANFERLHSSYDRPDTSTNVQSEGDVLHPVSLTLIPPVLHSASSDSISTCVANDNSNIMVVPQDGTVREPYIKEEPLVSNISRTSTQDDNENEKLIFATLPSASPDLQWTNRDVSARKPIPFWDRFGSDSHEQAHFESPSFECRICKEVFKQQSYLDRHLQTHKKENVGLVFESYPAETDLEIPAEKDFSAALISFDGTQDCASEAKTTYESQITAITQESVDVRGTIKDIDRVKKSNAVCNRYKRPFRFKCSYCPRKFRDKKDWRQHDNTHTGFKPYSCSVCGRKLTRQYSLKKHMMTHTGEKPVSCQHCSKAFRNKSGLLCHQKKHHPWVFDHTCCLCKTAHENTDALECHLRSDHEDVIRTVINQFLINDHSINASADSSCLSSPKQPGYRVQTDCADMEDTAVKYLSKRERRIDQAVATAIDLWLKCEGHEMITGIPKFKCSFCDKGFQNRKDWQRHENSHTGYKPYACDICGKRISRLHSLKAHRLTHSTAPTYVCHCGKGFRKQLSLVKHEESKNCTSLGVKLKTVFSEPNKKMADHENTNFDIDAYSNVPSGPPISLHIAELGQVSSTLSSRNSISRMPSCTIQYQCAYCKWKFSDVDIFKRHGCWLRRLLGKTRRKQVSCGSIHLKMYSAVCNVCHESFTTNKILERHLQLIHPHNTANQLNVKREKPDTTIECISTETVGDTPTARDGPDLKSGRSSSTPHPDDSNSVSNPTTVKIPVTKTRSKRVVITCRICQKNFTHRYTLKLHLMMHASETRYQCRLCHKRFFYKNGLKKHLQNHGPRQRSIFTTDANNSVASLI